MTFTELKLTETGKVPVRRPTAPGRGHPTSGAEPRLRGAELPTPGTFPAGPPPGSE